MTSPISSINDTDRLVRWIAYEFSHIPHTQLYYELFEISQATETNAEFGLQAYQMFQQTYIGTVPKVNIDNVDWPTVAQVMVDNCACVYLPERDPDEWDDGLDDDD